MNNLTKPSMSSKRRLLPSPSAQKGMMRAGLMLMAENQRTQFVWNTFMKDPAAQNGMTLAGFQPG